MAQKSDYKRQTLVRRLLPSFFSPRNLHCNICINFHITVKDDSSCVSPPWPVFPLFSPFGYTSFMLFLKHILLFWMLFAVPSNSENCPQDTGNINILFNLCAHWNVIFFFLKCSHLHPRWHHYSLSPDDGSLSVLCPCLPPVDIAGVWTPEREPFLVFVVPWHWILNYWTPMSSYGLEGALHKETHSEEMRESHSLQWPSPSSSFSAC